MTVIVGRRGHMENGEYVADQVKMQAADEETGCAGWAWADTEEEASEQAEVELAKAVEMHHKLQDPDYVEAMAREAFAFDMARAERLRQGRKQ